MEASHSWRVKTFQRVRCGHRGFHGLLLGIRFDALLISHHADGSAASKAAWCNCAWILLHCARHRTWRKRHKQKKMLFNQLMCRLTPVKPVQPKSSSWRSHPVTTSRRTHVSAFPQQRVKDSFWWADLFCLARCRLIDRVWSFTQHGVTFTAWVCQCFHNSN